MAKRRRGNDRPDTPLIENEVLSSRRGFVAILTPIDEGTVGIYRYMSVLRYGKISGEVFCKNPERRKELGLPAVIVDA